MVLVWIDSFLVAIFPSTHHAFYGDGPAIQAVTFPVIDGCQVYPGYTRRQQSVYRRTENESFTQNQANQWTVFSS